MEKKFRGEIPFWLKNKKNNLVYICSSNRNIDDYFFVLKDFYKGKILRIKKENEVGELKKYNYDLLEFINSNEKFIILISLDYFLEDYYSEANSIFIEKGKGAFAVYKAEGFTFEELEAAKAAGSLTKVSGAKELTMDEFWALDVEAIAPCALENAITNHEAELIKAGIICEGANGPITPEADEVLYKKGIVVTPDVLTNAGGVTVSYFEWVQNIYGYYWTEKEVEEKEERAMVDAFKPIWALKKEFDEKGQPISFRQATYMKSIKRIAEAMKIRGWY